MDKQVKPIPIQVNINEQPHLVCSACKNEYFRPVFMIHAISPVLFGTTQKTYALNQYFECTKCQAIIYYARRKEFGFDIISPDKKFAKDSFELEE